MNSLDGRHVARFVHPMRAMIHPHDFHPVPVFDHLELLEVLLELQGRGRELRVDPEELRVVALQTEVKEVLVFGVHRSRLVVGDHPAAEIHGVASLVDDALHAGVHLDLLTLERGDRGGVDGIRGALKGADDVVDDLGFDERLVALDVDDDVEFTAETVESFFAARSVPLGMSTSVITTSAPAASHARLMRTSSVATTRRVSVLAWPARTCARSWACPRS